MRILNLPIKKLLYYTAMLLTAVALVVGVFAVPSQKESVGAWVMMPVAYIICFIIMTQGRMIEGFVFASLIALVCVGKQGFFGEFLDSFYAVMASDDMIWMIGMIMAMGAILVLMERTGISYAFAEWLASKAKSRKGSLLATMLLGLIVFLDDYLNCILVGSSMRPVTDKYKVSREELAYVVDSTAAPVTILVPISTWFAFTAAVINGMDGVGEGGGMRFLIKAIPYNFYGWTALIVVLLFIVGVIPPFGPMKRAMERVKATGELAPPDSQELTEGSVKVEGARKINFLIVIALLVFFTVITGIDLMAGAMCTLIAMFFLFVIQRILSVRDFVDTCVKGFQSMIPVCTLLVFIFIFLNAIGKMGFEDYVIGAAEPYLRDIPWLMPLICFVIFSVTEFATGSTWGIYALAMPVVIPLANTVGANPLICVSAIFSAGAVGAHMCMYSDNMVLSGTASGCNIFRHAVTQLPYCLVGWVASAVLYGVTGYLFT